MKIKVIFDKSGDEIEFEAVNHDLVEYYVEALNSSNLNRFHAFDNITTIKDKILNVHNSLIASDRILRQVDLKGFIVPDNLGDYVDQRLLNFLHADWASRFNEVIDVRKNLNHNESSVREIAENLFHSLPDELLKNKLGPILGIIKKYDEYGLLNINIHALEDMFNQCKFQTENYIQLDNTFDKNKILSNSAMNLKFSFRHLGRTLYNKFLRGDDQLEFKDENNYNELLGFIEINFERYQTMPFSQEYLDWCSKNNRTPLGQNLNIGYLTDLDTKLYDYRLILSRNVIDNNFFTLQINKGN